MKYLVFTACGIGLVASACWAVAGVENEPTKDDASKAEAVKAELKRFEGTWKFVSMEFEGMAIPEASFKDSRMTCKGDQFTTKGPESAKGTFLVDPTAKPKTIDISLALGEGDGEKVTILGIYELEGDVYKICSGLPGKPRPTEFAAPKGSARGLQIMTRDKP